MPTPRKKGVVKKEAKRQAGRLATYANPAMTPRDVPARVLVGPAAKREKGVNFQDRLVVEEEELQSEIRHTLSVIHRVKRENERILRKQTMLFGATLDSVDDIKRNTEAVKQANLTLYQEMEQVKTLHNKLEIDLQEAKAKFDESTSILTEGKKASKHWTETEDEYLKSEARCNELTKANRSLKVLLIKHHINPNTNAEDLEKDSEVDERGSIKSSKSTPAKVAKRKLFVKGRQSSMPDMGVASRENTPQEQMNPAYLGFYKQLRESRDMRDNHKVDYYRTGVDLPKIELIRGKRTAYGSYINLFQLNR